MPNETTRESGIAEIVRRYFGAYVAKDRRTVEALLAADFAFTSPYDDRIGRGEYFERCWPGSETMRDLEIEKLVVAGDEAFVRYRIERLDDTRFRNVELIRCAGGRIAEIEVYFGRTLRHAARI